MSAASFLHSSFLQAISAVMLWPVRVEKVLESGRPGFESHLHRGSVPRSGPTSELKVGTPGATLPGAWRYGVSAGIGQPGVSIL